MKIGVKLWASILWRLHAYCTAGIAVITWLKNAKAVVVKTEKVTRYSIAVKQTRSCNSAPNAEASLAPH